MKLIKNIIYYGIIIFAIWFAWHTYTKTPCDRILEYDINFDDRFRITEQEFISFVEGAEKPWEDAAGKELFKYVPGSKFKVNLVFGEQQEKLYLSDDLSLDLDSQQSDLNALKLQYENAVSLYESALQEYNNRVEKYEQDVEFWNTQGGAPTATFKELQKESDDLEKKFQEVERLRVNANTLAEESNQEVQQYNNEVENYNELFVDAKQFDAGNTDGTEINIYSYDGSQELMTLITHEFGHLLGIDHVEDENAVMYFLLNEGNKGGVLKTADINALNLSCKLK